MPSGRDIRALALAAHDELLKYISVHNDIYGASYWRALRRLLPIPWLFEAIPYSSHADTLQSVRMSLQATLVEAATLADRGDQRLNSRLVDYVRALEHTVSLLRDVCSSLADKAEGAPYSWKEYRRTLAEYEKARINYSRLGGPLNDALRTVEREA